jgi:aminopeptidase N
VFAPGQFLRFFREFSAPVHVQADLTGEDRLFLIGSDPDPFNRWEAAQQIAVSMLARAADAIRDGETPVFDPRFAAELGRLAQDEDLDPAFRALALTLPSETDVAQAIGREVDPDAIHAARRALQSSLRREIGTIVAEAAGKWPAAQPYSPDAEQAGRRAFTHSAWGLSVAGGAMTGSELANLYASAKT